MNDATLIAKTSQARRRIVLSRQAPGYSLVGGTDLVLTRKLGRDPSPLVVPDVDERGVLWWVLVGSTARPVRVNGRPMPGTDIRKLRHGDRIELWDGTVIRFMAGSLKARAAAMAIAVKVATDPAVPVAAGTA